MSFPESFRSLRRLPCLDGWRCLSILLVLVGHSREVSGYDPNWDTWVRWLPDGRFGVEVFFVISGFLITFLLLKEREKTGVVSLKMFYIRRALRILPAYITFLLALLALCLFTSLSLTHSQWISLLTFTVIYSEPPCGHIWSLSVEEQFYLLWPFIFLWGLLKKEFPKTLFIILLAPLIIAPLFRVYGYLHPSTLLFHKRSFLTCCDSLAVGCLLGMLTGSYGTEIEAFVKRRPALLIIFGLLMIVIPLVASRLLILGFLTVPFTVTFNAIGVALLILVSLIRPDLLFFRFLEWKPIVALGVISYSLYLWQELFCTNPILYGFKVAPWFLRFPYWIVASFCAAVISYNFIEKPFISLKSRIQSKA